MPVAVLGLIVAAGRGSRAGAGLPKQYRAVGGKPLLRHAVEGLHGSVDAVAVIIHPDDKALYEETVAGLDVRPWMAGGATRQDSVRLGLEALGVDAPAKVLIHDAARAFMPAEVSRRVIAALDVAPGACPALPVADSLRTGAAFIDGEVARDGLHRVQTPQGFDYAAIRAAHAVAPGGCTDDAAVARAAGLSVALVAGDERGFKLTTPDDFRRADAMLGGISRAAQGYDVHRFGPGDHVWLCGVRIAHSHGLIGHSDADAGLHALTDALFGTIGEGDIGDHFPPSDPQWRGASSDQFLLHAAALIAARGGIIDHIDITLICELPKIGPHRAAMRARLAEILGLAVDQVSVKATTTEGLGFTGRREGLAASAMASVRVPR